MKNIMSNTSRKLALPAALAALLASPSAIAAPPKPGHGQPPVNLRSAGGFVVLSESGISATAGSGIVGNIGVSPIAATGITGFGLVMDAKGQFSKSSLVNGKVYASNYAVPTPAAMTTAVGDMMTAYNDAAGRKLPDATELGAGNISGLTIKPGLYKWAGVVSVNNGASVTLAGKATDVWIFQIGAGLTMGNGSRVIMTGGATAKNVFWQVSTQATLGTTSSFQGNILGGTAIVLNTGAVLTGRALAQTAVTLDASEIAQPNK